MLVLTALAGAETLKGTVTNATTGKPAANAEVTLLSLANGMNEAGSTRADAAGTFSFDLGADTGAPHLVRVTYQKVGYFKMAPPGTSSVELQVYDAARKLDGVDTSMQIMRFQSDGSALQVVELYAVANTSKPPRSLAGDKTYEIAVPAGAVIDESAALSPGGQPISITPAPVAGQKDRYAFDFPLRPGETQFQIAYHLPYSGQATLNIPVLHNAQHFATVMPGSMQVSASGAKFSPVADNSGDHLQVATGVHAGDAIVLAISGAGTLSTEPGQDGENNEPQGGTRRAAGPGGGLGKPIDSPDPLSRYRWPLLGLLTAALVAGGFYVATRRMPAAAAADTGASLRSPLPGKQKPQPASKAAPSASRSSLLLDAMKEELFELELERQNGRISEAEYANAKAALEQTLSRALARTKK